MTQAAFSNALRIMRSIDKWELHRAGVIDTSDGDAWRCFRNNPFEWFVRASDDQQASVWGIIQSRQPEGLRE